MTDGSKFDVIQGGVGEDLGNDAIVETSASIKAWKDESNQKLIGYGSDYRVVNNKYKTFIISVLILSIVVLVVGFIWLGYNDKFKTQVRQDVTCPEQRECPNCNCPSCPSVNIPSCPETPDCNCNPSFFCNVTG